MKTVRLDPGGTAATAPDLLAALKDAQEGIAMPATFRDTFTASTRPPVDVGHRYHDVADRERRIDELMAWITDPDALDWALVERNEDWNAHDES